MRLDYLDYLCCPNCKNELSLAIEEQDEKEINRGTLECFSCGKGFEISDGLPKLIFTENLKTSELSTERWYDSRPNYDYRPTAFRLGIWELTFRYDRVRDHWVSRLDVGKGMSLLEIGVGNGGNLPFLEKGVGKSGRLHGMDISSENLKVARKRMGYKGVQVDLIHGNATYLPYRSDKFDAVLSVGGFNEFGDKKRAINEMHRVAKAGAKIVLCDEGLAPDRAKTLLGKYILKCSREFANKPPVNLLPEEIVELNLSWICQRTFWVLEFRKQI